MSKVPTDYLLKTFTIYELEKERMKKAGQFFLTFVPFLLVIGIQFIAMFFMIGISAMIEGTWYNFSKHVSIMDVYTDLTVFFTRKNFNTSLMLVYVLLTIGLFSLWYYIKYDGHYLVKPKTVFHPVAILGIVMLVPGMQFLSTYIISLVAAVFPHWLEVYERLLETAGLDNSLTFGLFLYSVMLGPISEELIFRGVTMRQAKKCIPFWAANLLQAFLFGAFHMNMIQGIYAFFLGMILGYVCEKSGNIYNAILLHMLFNFWGTMLSQFITIEDSTFSLVIWFVFAIVMTIGGLIVFTIGTKKLHLKNTNTTAEHI